MLAIDTRNSQAHFRKVCAELVKQITHSVLFLYQIKIIHQYKKTR